MALSLKPSVLLLLASLAAAAMLAAPVLAGPGANLGGRGGRGSASNPPVRCRLLQQAAPIAPTEPAAGPQPDAATAFPGQPVGVTAPSAEAAEADNPFASATDLRAPPVVLEQSGPAAAAPAPEEAAALGDPAPGPSGELSFAQEFRLNPAQVLPPPLTPALASMQAEVASPPSHRQKFSLWLCFAGRHAHLPVRQPSRPRRRHPGEPFQLLAGGKPPSEAEESMPLGPP